MKKIILLFIMMLAFVGITSASNVLVAYFSWGGNTKALAEEIQQQTGADIYRIEPAVPYPTDYNTVAYTISRNEKENNERPALKETDRDFSRYDYIFVGCPVWWFDAPMIIHTFLETYDFAGKTVIPFCTYYTATYETLNDIVNATPNSNHLEGLGMSGASTYDASSIAAWLRRIGLDGGTTAIKDIQSVGKSVGKEVYNLRGQKVSNDSTGELAPGVYVTQGRKFYVK